MNLGTSIQRLRESNRKLAERIDELELMPCRYDCRVKLKDAYFAGCIHGCGWDETYDFTADYAAEDREKAFEEWRKGDEAS